MNTHTHTHTHTQNRALTDGELNTVSGGNFISDAVHSFHHGLKSGMESFFDPRHLKELGRFLAHGGGQSNYGEKMFRKLADSIR